VYSFLEQTFSDQPLEIKLQGCPRALALDVDMLALMLEEGMSNCIKYKSEGSTPQLKASLVEEDGHTMLCTALINTIPRGRPVLSGEECASLFITGRKGQSVASRSDGIGLGTVAAAAKAAKGKVSLRMYKSEVGDAHAEYSILLPAVVLPSGSDSSATQTIYRSRALPPAEASPGIKEEEGSCTAQATAAAPDDSDFVCVGADDSELMRPLIRASFAKLGAKAHVLGATADEIDRVVDVALGLCLTDGTPVQPQSAVHADLVLLDVNMDIGSRPYANGCDLAAELRQRDFRGMIALYTAGTQRDLSRLLKDCNANTVLLKSMDGPPLYQQLLEGYRQFARMQPFRVRMPACAKLPDQRPSPAASSQIARGPGQATESESPDPLFDSSRCMEDYGLDTDTLAELVNELFDPSNPLSMTTTLRKLEGPALADSQRHSLQKSAFHRIASDARMYGAVRLANELAACPLPASPQQLAVISEIAAQTQKAAETKMAKDCCRAPSADASSMN